MARKTLSITRRVIYLQIFKEVIDNVSLSNAKPSAIFALKGKAQAASLSDPSPTITLGISLEPLASIESQVQTLHAPATMAVGRLLPPLSIVAQRIAKNLFNFLGSFATQNLPVGVMTLGGLRPDATYIPLKAFEDWWNKFNHKVENDPGFLERESD
jgi:protein Hikeshi